MHEIVGVFGDIFSVIVVVDIVREIVVIAVQNRVVFFAFPAENVFDYLHSYSYAKKKYFKSFKSKFERLIYVYQNRVMPYFILKFKLF